MSVGKNTSSKRNFGFRSSSIVEPKNSSPNKNLGVLPSGITPSHVKLPSMFKDTNYSRQRNGLKTMMPTSVSKSKSIGLSPIKGGEKSVGNLITAS
jgi:hypothetical protein